MSSVFAVEEPYYSESLQRELYIKHMPLKQPSDKDSKEYKCLLEFCEGVEYIIQTVNENEYQAATTFMSSPDDKMFSRAVVFPQNAMVVGMFGKTQIKTALIQTEPALNMEEYVIDALKAYPNAHYVIGVGVCYAYDSSTKKFGDVVVSEKIADYTNFKVKYDEEGKMAFEDRGETISVIHHLHKTFCLNKEYFPGYPVTADKSRVSRVHSGTLISPPILINNKDVRDALHRQRETAIGGEMEGGQLMKFVSERKVEGIIMIKGVSDYADGKKGKKWQFTASMAALHYIEQKL